MESLFLFFLSATCFFLEQGMQQCLCGCGVPRGDDGGPSGPSLEGHKGPRTIFAWMMFSPNPLSSAPNVKIVERGITEPKITYAN